jgi:hypothetical protein
MVALAFLAPVPHGHSNVHLAIYRRLLALPAADAPAHIHVLADEPFRKRVTQLPASPHTRVSFHALNEEDAYATVANPDTLRVPPLSLTARGGTRALHGSFVPIMCPPATLYLSQYARMLDVLKDIKPDLVVVDVLFAALGADVCRTLHLRYAILAPIGSLDVSLFTQPGGRALWKYPMRVSSSTYERSH